jgi:hypothetical protein
MDESGVATLNPGPMVAVPPAPGAVGRTLLTNVSLSARPSGAVAGGGQGFRHASIHTPPTASTGAPVSIQRSDPGQLLPAALSECLKPLRLATSDPTP